MTPDEIRDGLRRGLTPLQCRLEGRLLDALEGRCRDWLRHGGAADADLTADSVASLPLVRFLQDEVRRLAERFAALRDRQAEFDRAHDRAASEAERVEHILDFARDLGATEKQLRGDRAAFARWFGPDAVTERRARRQAEAERALAVCLGRLGAVAAEALQAGYPWHRLGVADAVRPLLTHPGDERVVSAAFRCLATALHALPAETAEDRVEAGTVAVVYRAATDPAGPVAVQGEALAVLAHLSLASFRRVVELRLARPVAGDDLFVRRRAVQLVAEHLASDPDLAGLFPLLLADPSPFVRQAAARALTGDDFRRLALEDPAAEVRGAALVEGLARVRRGEEVEAIRAIVAESLAIEKDAFVLHVAIHVTAEGAALLAGSDLAERWRAELVPGLERLHTTAASLPVRRWAALAREQVWCEADPAARALRDALRPRLTALRPGDSCRVPYRLLNGYDDATIGRVLAVLAQDDFGYDLERGWFSAKVTRGPVFRFRFWRFFHEVRHPDPAKRQAFRHTIGRVSDADLRAPSAILSELAETKVPGEPLHMGSEAGWRPYLPLPDDAVSAVTQVLFPRPVRFHTAEGVTQLSPPPTPWGRAWAWLRLTTSFARYARLRNWREGDPTDPAAYVRALERLGFKVTFTPHDAAAEPDPAVDRFFPPAASAALLPANVPVVNEFVDYFPSLGANSLLDLAVFATAGLALFVGRHWYRNWRMKRARARLPLVLGGWGTRGKSGTQRLKAALITGLGYGLVCKTTGCEAMFLHANPYGKTREMFLYRSYDKATIWEQTEVVRMAAALGADVFLWECMGLNPGYVKILQKQWMRDDASTITNTYPDHEDVQGPAGINIPQVMTNFIPENSLLVTSEEQMRPILTDAAARLGTEVRPVGWLEAGLLARDVRARFPYEEHPYNIALVLGLAAELGIDADFALKEMADRVVPDLGVLKTAPPAPVRTRKLEFSNGMSANERHGCVTNWSRLGFDRQDVEAEPGVWLTTVVNNRADRIPRSRVFAGVLVNDLSADRHVLIGGNLSGLMAYVREAWDESLGRLTLWPDSGEAPAEVFVAAARRFRVPFTETMLDERLRVMLAGLPGIDAAAFDPSADGLSERLQAAGVSAELAGEVAAFHEKDRVAFGEYQAFAARLVDAKPEHRAELEAAYRELLWRWFERKLVVVWDYHATGEQIVDRIVKETPPGFRNRVMGIQNIKGTGLDFVYRWEAWSACHAACTRLRSADAATAERGLRELAEFAQLGVASEEYVRESVAIARARPFAQKEAFQALLDLVVKNLDAKMEAIRASLGGGGGSGKKAGWFDRVLAFVEGLLDAGDAIRRRKTADRIYRDLIDERIGPDRAVDELKGLISRQKGGWLKKQLTKWWQSVVGKGEAT